MSTPSSALRADERRAKQTKKVVRAKRRYGGLASPSLSQRSQLHVPSHRLDGQVKGKERDADEKRHQDARLLRLLTYQQHRPRKRQLPNHLQRLPVECAGFVISPQESGGATQWRRRPREES
eukprot:4713029-Prymnesium_polylepis.2